MDQKRRRRKGPARPVLYHACADCGKALACNRQARPKDPCSCEDSRAHLHGRLAGELLFYCSPECFSTYEYEQASYG